MRALFLDLASHSGLLACTDDNGVVAKKEIDHRIGDAELIMIFEGALEEAGWKTKELERIACATGPGGFMSLRVAVAFANTFIHQLKIPGAGIHLSDLYHARSKEEDILWLHSTKKREIFARGFGSFHRLWPEPEHLFIDALLERLPEDAPWMGELIPEHEAEVLKRGGKRADLKPVESVLPAFIASLTYGKETLEPWYGRKW